MLAALEQGEKTVGSGGVKAIVGLLIDSEVTNVMILSMLRVDSRAGLSPGVGRGGTRFFTRTSRPVLSR